jgi:hypothetical protein
MGQRVRTRIVMMKSPRRKHKLRSKLRFKQNQLKLSQ